MSGTLRKFLTNIICGCIYNKNTRRHTRVVLNSNIISDIRFMRKNLNTPLRKIKTFIGYQARSLLISANDEYIFKFPLRRVNSDELALREKRLVDAFISISPIPIPTVDIFEHRGILVRKYKFIHGAGIRQISPELIKKHKTKLAKQIARFMYEIGTSDPIEIRDLKPKPNTKPGYMYGWTQGDIFDNFIVDTKTMKIIAFIDWEDCEFRDFSNLFRSDRHSLMPTVKREYDKLYYKK